ncbi:ATP-binding protein [Allosalinactinospora lopnorensis]|uniref:ATP-binding protein n=1 Tax=Allosalinactinospora lopnorensis TaxID=1352348 RepID=UPI000B004F34|nr:AAA family ATPase [Allosalinactinospora lopnorensis]
MREPFIGRDREQAELAAGLQDAIDGRGGLFLVAGQPGIGKTALADRLAEHAVGQGARVLWGRSWESGGAAPYWMWTQIIRALADSFDDELDSLLTPEAAAHIALLVPELAGRFGRPAPSVHTPGSDAARFYLFEATTGFLKAVSSAQPLVLVLDDAFTGDHPSRLLLRFLARDIRPSRLLAVVTYRDMAARSGEAADMLADLVREGRLLRLRGLDRTEVARLIAEVSGTAPWEGKVSAIHEATGGNPLFVREVTRLVAAGEALDRPGRLSITVPDSLRGVISRRLAPLSADAVQVLSAAAVVGRDFDVALVSAASDLPAERVLGSVSEAVEMGAVAEAAEAAGLYRFSHPLMREAIYEGLPLPARLQMHQRVGTAIERLHGLDPAPYLGELAYHFAQAAAAGKGAKAEEYARQAGDRAMLSYAYEEAAVHYQRALEAGHFAGLGEAERCELLLRLGGAQARAGDYQQARGSFQQAAEIARRLGTPERSARAELGFGEPQVEGGTVDQQLLALLREALAGLGPADNPLRARALARMSLELTFADEAVLRESHRDALSREAVEMARRLGDAPARAIACRARWMAAWGPDGLKERTALSEEILRLGRETGDRELELVGRARRITCSMEAGNIRAVDTDIVAHARLAGDLRMPYHAWTAATIRAGRALLDGSFEAAEELADRAPSLLPTRPNARMAHLNQLTPIRWEQGRLSELRAAWQQLAEQFPQAAYAKGWLSLAEAERGRADEAGRSLLSLVEELPGLSRGGLWLPALATASLAAARLGDADAAGAVYPLLRPYADRTIVAPMPHPVVCFGPASSYLALLAATSSRWEEAAGHFESAISENSRMGAAVFLARTRYEYARMLIRRGRAADRRNAAELLEQAQDAALALGMAALGRECASLREEPAAETVAAAEPTGAGAASVFRREGDYWTLAYEGSLFRLRDTKGLHYLARLLAEPGREFHVVDLEAAEGPAGEAPPRGSGARARDDGLRSRPGLGDAGELLDARAKAEYRARIEELRADLDEAESFNDPARAARNREEIDAIAHELAGAVGLGGRDRRAASHAERARLNVTRAIRAAMANIARSDPSLGRHLATTVRTGRYCCYTPDPRAGTTWETRPGRDRG